MGGCYALIYVLEDVQTYDLITTVDYADVVVDEGSQGFTATISINKELVFKQDDPHYLIMTLDGVFHNEITRIVELLDEHMALCRTP